MQRIYIRIFYCFYIRFLFVQYFRKFCDMNTVRCGSSAMMSMTLLSVFVLVQILCVYGELTTVAVTGEVSSATDKNTCEKIRIKCAYHEGCYHALQNYFEKCDRILRADSKTCPEPCMHALVTLTSTEQGSGLLDVSVNVYDNAYTLYKKKIYLS